MNDEKWADLLVQIKNMFGIISQETEDVTKIENDGSEKIIGSLEKVVFENDLGKMMVTRKSSPLVVGRNENYHRKGIAATSFIYSPTEKSHHLAAYKWNESSQDWEEISLKATFSL